LRIYGQNEDGEYVFRMQVYSIFMNKKEKSIRKEIVEEIIKRAKAANNNVKIETRG